MENPNEPFVLPYWITKILEIEKQAKEEKKNKKVENKNAN